MQYVTFTTIEFDDGSINLLWLHEGSLEDCQEVLQKVLKPNSIKYTGDKRPIASKASICSKEQWEDLQDATRKS